MFLEGGVLISPLPGHHDSAVLCIHQALFSVVLQPLLQVLVLRGGRLPP